MALIRGVNPQLSFKDLQSYLFIKETKEEMRRRGNLFLGLYLKTL